MTSKRTKLNNVSFWKEIKMAVIETKNLYKTFDIKGNTVNALNDINLSIDEGDIYGIIGMSGAGKSTLVRCLNFLERPTKGSVIVDKEDLGTLSDKDLRKKRSNIGMIFQSFNLLNQRTVLENVMQPLRIAKVPKKERVKKALEMLKIVGLEDKKDEYPSRLSGGQRQRVAIARALSNDPKVLLCDEATSALDPKMTGEILDLLKEINQTRKLTIVIITHEMAVVEKICDKVAIIDDGELAEVGDVKDIFEDPKSEAARKLVFPSNPFDPTNEDAKLIRVVFDGLSAGRSFIADLVETTGKKVTILSANTRSVNGVGYGQMVMELPGNETDQKTVIDFFRNNGLKVQEVKKV